MSDVPTEPSGGPKGFEQPRASKFPWIAPASLIFFALLFFGLSFLIAPLYFGSPGTTTGTIMSFSGDHPVVSYTVDGVDYSVTTGSHDPSWKVGDNLTIVYNPHNPAQASTPGGRTVAVVFRLLTLPMALAGITTGIIAVRLTSRRS